MTIEQMDRLETATLTCLSTSFVAFVPFCDKIPFAKEGTEGNKVEVGQEGAVVTANGWFETR